MVVLGIVAGGAIALVYLVWDQKGIEGIKTAVLILGNVYGLVILVVLLSYALFNLPFYFWNKTNRLSTVCSPERRCFPKSV